MTTEISEEHANRFNVGDKVQYECKWSNEGGGDIVIQGTITEKTKKDDQENNRGYFHYVIDNVFISYKQDGVFSEWVNYPADLYSHHRKLDIYLVYRRNQSDSPYHYSTSVEFDGEKIKKIDNFVQAGDNFQVTQYVVDGKRRNKRRRRSKSKKRSKSKRRRKSNRMKNRNLNYFLVKKKF